MEALVRSKMEGNPSLGAEPPAALLSPAHPAAAESPLRLNDAYASPPHDGLQLDLSSPGPVDMMLAGVSIAPVKTLCSCALSAQPHSDIG